MEVTMHGGSTMAWARTGRLIVTVHGPTAADHVEWCDYLEWVREVDVPIHECVALVLSHGGGPNTVQRGMLTDFMDQAEAKPKTVLLTESKIARGIGIALSWFNVTLRILSPQQVDDALSYLEVAPDEAAEGKRLLASLSDMLQHDAQRQATSR